MRQHYKYIFILLMAFFEFSSLYANNHLDEFLSEDDFRKKIAPMLMFGFPGFSEESNMVEFFLNEIENQHIGGVVLFSKNINTSEQLKALTESIKRASNDNILIAVDQEGGRVERLSAKNGFHHTESPKTIALSQSLEDAQVIYENMAKMLFDHGINFNLAPVVDLDNFDAPCPVIGGLERSFSNKTETVVSFAKSFIHAHKMHKILTSLKHFPGHGFAPYDSHIGLVDVTDTVSPLELEPFFELIKENLADSVMTAHIMNKNLDPKYPATMSRNILQGVLRDDLSFDGVVISDDMQMGAIKKEFSLKDAIVNAINAGCDILIFSNNTPELRKVEDIDSLLVVKNELDFLTPYNVSHIIYNAYRTGGLTMDRIDKSLERIQKIKNTFQDNDGLKGKIRKDEL